MSKLQIVPVVGKFKDSNTKYKNNFELRPKKGVNSEGANLIQYTFGIGRSKFYVTLTEVGWLGRNITGQREQLYEEDKWPVNHYFSRSNYVCEKSAFKGISVIL